MCVKKPPKLSSGYEPCQRGVYPYGTDICHTYVSERMYETTTALFGGNQNPRHQMYQNKWMGDRAVLILAGQGGCFNARDFLVGTRLSCCYAPGSACSLIDSRHQDKTLWMPQLWPVHCKTNMLSVYLHPGYFL